MSLRLAGEEFSVVQGLDALGWPRKVEANDADPGMKITQNGSGPALQVVSGDIAVGANKLKTTNLMVKEGDVNTLYIRNAADNAYKNIIAEAVEANSGFASSGSLTFYASGLRIDASNVNDHYLSLRARDNGVGMVEVARISAAADPYFMASIPMVLNPSLVPGAPLEGHFWYDSTAKKLKFYNGTAVETVTSA